MGDNGVLNQAQESSTRTNRVSAKEAIDLAMTSLTTEFLADVWTDNVNAKIEDYVTIGKIADELEKSGYELQLGEYETSEKLSDVIDDSNRTMSLSINKEGSLDTFTFLMTVADRNISVGKGILEGQDIEEFDPGSEMLCDPEWGS